MHYILKDMRILLVITALALAASCSEPIEPGEPPLEVTGTYPVQQARNIPVNTDIRLSFNRTVSITGAEAAFDPQLIYPQLANNSIFTGTDGKSLAVNYHEHEYLLAGTTYAVTFTGITDGDGNELAPYALYFVTQ